MKKYYSISGMHCRSCELILEQNIGHVAGVTQVRVNHRTGAASVTFAPAVRPDDQAVVRAIHDAGYRFGRSEKLPLVSSMASDWFEIAVGLSLVFILFLFYKISGLDRLGASLTGTVGPASALTVGLIAGVSTCMALIGGLVLGISARHAQRFPEAPARKRFVPHLMFNTGRIGSFILLGGALGALGSVFRISSGLLGALVIAAGIIMIVLGIKLTGLFPRVQNIALPSGIGRLLGLGQGQTEYGHGRAATLGAATFLLPCAFTQSMQLFAITTGSFTQGALVMGAFAVGTMPGLVGIGGLASFARGGFGRLFFKTAGLVVLLFGFWNLSNGWNLTGIILRQTVPTAAIGKTAGAESPAAEVRDGIQYIRTEQWAGGYNPKHFSVKADIPVVWTIHSTNSYTCASSIRIPALDIQRNLKAGENVIEFTPTEQGLIKYSCSMGMFTGTIEVIK